MLEKQSRSHEGFPFSKVARDALQIETVKAVA
jgi:hypothetical protein